MPTVSKGKVVAEEAWEKVGIRMSQEESDELQRLKNDVKIGRVLSFEQEKRLHILRKKSRSVAHIE